MKKNNNLNLNIFYNDDIKSFVNRLKNTGSNIISFKLLKPIELYAELLNILQYLNKEDLELVKKAYNFSCNAHKNQKRKSKEDFIIHPLWTSIILAEMRLDRDTIVAGLLHDVIEDCNVTYEDVKHIFNKEIADLVEGVTKLSLLNYDASKLDIQAENLRKMFLAMSHDIRIIIIKLADRLHNMRTLQYMSKEKQLEKAKETMDIYSPIAERLGMLKIRIELDDLAFFYTNPDKYLYILEELNKRQKEREKTINYIILNVSKYVTRAHIQSKIYGRVKHIFSIYRKMINQNKTIDEIYDLFAIRILVDTTKECYNVLGLIHDMYIPIPGRFKDYIAIPKLNNYQSLHTTVIDNNGNPFEVQIRTHEMNKQAEYGMCAHWKYKEGYNKKNEENKEDAKITWLREVLDMQQELKNNKEFISLLKRDLDLFSDHIYCFTPTGDIINLPKGSNTIDFAYKIHSAIGNKMIGAKVNDKSVPIEYKIKNGDRVEILIDKDKKGPDKKWLDIVISVQAKNKINLWFKNKNRIKNITKGRFVLENIIKENGFKPEDMLEEKYIDILKEKYKTSFDSILASIGHGTLNEHKVYNKLIEEYKRNNKIKIKTTQNINNTFIVNKKDKYTSFLIKTTNKKKLILTILKIFINKNIILHSVDIIKLNTENVYDIEFEHNNEDLDILIKEILNLNGIYSCTKK